MRSFPTAHDNTDRQTVIFLLLLCVISLILFLGGSPFNTRGEPREAVVAMSMLHDGNWILPVNNGDEIAFKPPLLHWLVALLSWPLGEVTVFASRLPSALAATAMVVATYVFFARRHKAGALLTALILLTCFEVHRAAMTCRVDMLLAALTVMGIYALYTWGERGLRGVPWWGIVAVAGAALTKGPVGVVLPCGAVALCLLLQKRATFWTLLWKFLLVAIAALVPLTAWYCAAYGQPHGGERFLQLIYEENVLRFTGQMSYASHINPWWYNVMTLLTGLLPYTLLFLFALPIGLKGIPKLLRALQKKRHAAPLRQGGMAVLRAAVARCSAVDFFAFVSFATIFIFYCIPASKRSVYLLPLYPFAAYGVARFMLWMACRHRGLLRALAIVLATLALLLTLTFVGIKCGLVPETLFTGRHAAENRSYLAAIENVSWNLKTIALFLLPLIAGGTTLLRRSHPIRATVLLTFLLLLSFEGLYKPAVMQVKSDKSVAYSIAQIQQATALPVYSYRTDVLEANRMHPFTINFYMGDCIVPFEKAAESPARALLVTGDDEVQTFLQQYPHYAATLLLDTHHRSCDDKKIVKLYEVVRR